MCLVAIVLVGAALATYLTHRGSSASSGTHVDSRAGRNLLPNAGFDRDRDLNGVADGLVTWGSSSFSLIKSPETDGGHAQRLAVAPGGEGGMWFEVPAQAGARYTQSAALAVTQRDAGAAVDMILEWYDSTGRLLDYRLAPVSSPMATAVRHSQTAKAPPGTMSVRFVINIAGGGAVVVDDARLTRA